MGVFACWMTGRGGACTGARLKTGYFFLVLVEREGVGRNEAGRAEGGNRHEREYGFAGHLSDPLEIDVGIHTRVLVAPVEPCDLSRTGI
jgi:hypothetical protein